MLFYLTIGDCDRKAYYYRNCLTLFLYSNLPIGYLEGNFMLTDGRGGFYAKFLLAIGVVQKLSVPITESGSETNETGQSSYVTYMITIRLHIKLTLVHVVCGFRRKKPPRVERFFCFQTNKIGPKKEKTKIPLRKEINLDVVVD